jgi:ferredoxin
MGVHVDPTKCTGIGNCEVLAPNTFEIGDDAQAHVIADDPSGQDLADAQRAVVECPTSALSID